VILAVAFFSDPLRTILERYTERILYGKSYDYRQMVLTFASKMNRITDMSELAKTMLQPIVRAINASQVSLLLYVDGYYQSYYAERFNPEEPVISTSFRENGPIIEWLQREDKPLYRETIIRLPEFEALLKQERDFIEAANISFFYSYLDEFSVLLHQYSLHEASL
jgi:hypothetical protein